MFSFKVLMRRCNELFVPNRTQIMSKAANLTQVLGNVPLLALDLLGIELDKANN